MKKIQPKPAIKGERGGCLTCSLTETILSLDANIIAGFGSATIRQDGKLFYDAPMNLAWDEAKELSECEEIAKKTQP
jgi:hypothetical protein